MSKGFTLIEVLVVLFIVSIVAAVSLLSIGYNDNKRIETFVGEVTQTLNLAEEQAILMSTILGLSYDGNRFKFSQYFAASEKEKSKWILLQDKVLAIDVPSQLSIRINTLNAEKEEKKKIDPQIIISTNGDLTPFTIYVAKKGKKATYAIIGTEDGTITSQRLD